MIARASSISVRSQIGFLIFASAMCLLLLSHPAEWLKALLAVVAGSGNGIIATDSIDRRARAFWAACGCVWVVAAVLFLLAALHW